MTGEDRAREPAAFFVVARVARAHGTKGHLLVDPETDHAEAVFVPGRRLKVDDPPAGLPATLTISAAAPHGRTWRLEVDELADRDAALRYRGRNLSLPPTELVGLEEGEYFVHDLVGMEVVDDRTEAVGRVDEVYEAPGGILLGVEVEGKERLIPFGRATVLEVDLDARVLKVRLPAGLLDV